MTKTSVKNRLFLMIAIAVTFLVLALITSAIFLVKADHKAQAANLTKGATCQMSTVAEALKSSNGNLEKATQLLRSHKAFDVTKDTLTLYYNDEFLPSTKGDAKYKSVITLKSTRACYQYTIRSYEILPTKQSEKVFYELSFDAIKQGVI